MIKVNNKKDFEKELNSSQKVLAFFYANWCPYCRAFVPVFNKDVGNFREGTIMHVILDDYDNPIWEDYDIEAVPTVILFEKGKVCKRLDGKFGVGLKEKQFTTWLNEFNCK